MPEITIYSTTTCPYCILLKSYLSNHKIKFKEVVLDKEPQELQAFTDNCGSMSVPCTHIIKDNGAKVQIVGFDKENIDKHLGIDQKI